MFRKCLSLLLALCMLLSFGAFSPKVFAEDEITLIVPEEELSLLHADEPNNPPYTGTCGDSLTWTLTADGTLTISGSGEMENYDIIAPPWKNRTDQIGERINIKKLIVGEGGTSIGNGALSWEGELSDVTLPDSLKKIGVMAFFHNSVLTGVSLPEGLTAVGDYAFEYSDLRWMRIPSTLTAIGREAFAFTKISAFFCAGGTSFRAVDGVLYSYDKKTLVVYPSARATMVLEIPAGTETISVTAFKSCAALTNVTLPEGLTTIGANAFEECVSLSGVTIPESVTSIVEAAFRGDKLLSYAPLPAGLTELGDGVFMYCESMTEAIIPEGITKLGWASFMDSGLSYVELPATLTKIVYGCFSGCKDLPQVLLPDSLQSIGAGAFYGCASLTGIDIPASVSEIDISAFAFCDSLRAFCVDDGNAFYASPDGALYVKDGTKLLQVPGGLTGVYTMRDGVTEVEYGAMMGCRKLTKIVFSDTVDSVKGEAMSRCDSLEKVVFGSA